METECQQNAGRANKSAGRRWGDWPTQKKCPQRNYFTIGNQTAAGGVGAPMDAFHRRLILGRLGVEDIFHVGLRVAIVEREQRGLHLNHELVTGQEDVIDVGQRKLVFLDLARGQALRLVKAMDIAAAEDFDPDRQFVTGHARLRALRSAFEVIHSGKRRSA